MPVSAPYTVTDANTVAVEVTFKWRVVVPSDTSLAVAPPADFKGGAYPSGSGVIAANAVTRAASWTLETVPNLVVTIDRYFDVEVYDVLPADANLTNMRVRTKLAEDDVSTAPVVTNVYGPLDGAADSGVLNFESNRQQFGRVFRAAAPKWKAKVGAVRPGSQYSYVEVILDDNAKRATFTGRVFTAAGGTPLVVNYDGAAPVAGDRTDLISDAVGVRYMIGDRVLFSVPFNTVWRGDIIDSNDTIENEMPGKFGESNAHEVVANGIYAARLGAIQ